MNRRAAWLSLVIAVVSPGILLAEVADEMADSLAELAPHRTFLEPGGTSDDTGAALSAGCRLEPIATCAPLVPSDDMVPLPPGPTCWELHGHLIRLHQIAATHWPPPTAAQWRAWLQLYSC